MGESITINLQMVKFYYNIKTHSLQRFVAPATIYR